MFLLRVFLEIQENCVWSYVCGNDHKFPMPGTMNNMNNMKSFGALVVLVALSGQVVDGLIIKRAEEELLSRPQDITRERYWNTQITITKLTENRHSGNPLPMPPALFWSQHTTISPRDSHIDTLVSSL